MLRIRFPDKPLYDLLLLAFLLAVAFGASLGSRPYSAPSEARYIEIGREMAETGDYVTPHLDYVKYFEKPPLFYWVQALNTKLLGIGPFVSRIPTMKFAILLCLITYGLGRMLYGRLAGLLSAGVLGTTLYLFALSRVVLVDVPVSVFITATLASFLYIADAPEGRRRTFVLYLMYVAAAGAVLTKGLIGMVLPGAVALLWMALTGRMSLISRLRLPSGIALFLLLAAPWHILVSMRNPEFPHFYFIHEHLERYLTKEHGRYQPDWFFAVVLLAGLFPWLTFAPQACATSLKQCWANRKQQGAPLFLLIWAALIFVFFSLSDSKLIPYILPIFPPIAVMLGNYFAGAWQDKNAPFFVTGLIGMALMLIAMAIVPGILPNYLDPLSKVIVALSQAQTEINYLSFASLVMLAALLVVYIQGRTRHVILLLLVIATALLEFGDAIAAHYNKDSMAEVAGAINSMHEPNYEVATYHAYFQDLPVYLGKRVTIVDWLGELEFGSKHQDTSAWLIDDKTFWDRWLKNDHTMFVVMRDEVFLSLIKGKKYDTDLHLYAGVQSGHILVFMNHPAKKSGEK